MRIPDRIWSRIEEQPGGCWLWLGAKTGGMNQDYGVTTWRGKYPKSILVHRIMFEEFNGAIPPGFDVHHVCANKGCVNPNHLKVVTRQENILANPGRCNQFTKRKKR